MGEYVEVMTSLSAGCIGTTRRIYHSLRLEVSTVRASLTLNPKPQTLRPKI